LFLYAYYNVAFKRCCVYRTLYITGALLHLWHISTIIHYTHHQVASSLLSFVCTHGVIVLSSEWNIILPLGTGVMHQWGGKGCSVLLSKSPVVDKERLRPASDFFWLDIDTVGWKCISAASCYYARMYANISVVHKFCIFDSCYLPSVHKKFLMYVQSRMIIFCLHTVSQKNLSTFLCFWRINRF